jgi:iron-sulfur cluster assembly protein
MGIALTENAARHISTMLDKRGHGVGIRLATKKSGCTGFSYVVDFADEVSAQDMVFESQDIRVVLNKQDYSLLDGTEVDYVKNNAINFGFEFRNPNVKDVCGCGESFGV